MKGWQIFLCVVLAGFLVVSFGCAKPSAPTTTPAPAPAPVVTPTPTPAATSTPTPKVTPTPASTPVQPTVLHWADVAPPEGLRGDTMRWMAEEANKRTGGRIKIEFHWSSSLLKGPEMVSGVGKGTADIGIALTSYHPAQISLWGVGDVFPFARTTPQQKAKLFWQLSDEISALRSQVEMWNLGLWSMFVYEPYDLFVDKEVRQQSDLKGLKIRAVGEGLLTALKAAGAVGVYLEPAEIYTGIQRGIVNGMAASNDVAARYKLQEVVKSRVVPGFQSIGVCLYTINLNTWKKLPADVQKIMSELGREYTLYHADKLAADSDRIWKTELSSKVKLAELPAAEVEKWANEPMVRDLGDAWAKDLNAKGLPATIVLERYKQLAGIK